MGKRVKGIGLWAAVIAVLCTLSVSLAEAVPGSPGVTNLTSDAFSKSNAIFYNPANDRVRDLSGGAVNHILIRSDHGTASKIRLGIYYPTTTTGAQTIDIVQNANICTGFPNTNSPAVTFTASIRGLSQNIRTVSSRDMCGSGSTFYSRNITIPASIINNPASIDTTMAQKVITLDIQFTPYIMGLGLGNDHTVTFKAVATTGGGRIGTKDADGSANNAIVGKNSGGAGNLQIAYPFGLPCSQNNPITDRVVLVDADNGTGNQDGHEMYFYVQALSGSTWRTLRENDYMIGGSIQVSGDTRIYRGNGNNPIVTFIPKNGDDDTRASVNIPNIQPRVKYRMIVEKLRKSGDSGNNYIYVGLPGDGIFGAQNFTCPAPYDLNPSVTLSKSFAEAGESVAVTPRIENMSTTAAGAHNWTVDRVEYAPAQPQKTAAVPLNASGSVCSSPLYNPRANCTNFITAPPSQRNFAARTSAGYYRPFPPNNSSTFTIPANAAVGTKYCFAASVQGPNPAAGANWKHSQASCVIVGAKPKIQIWGHDARSFGSIDTSISNLSAATYGSWGEYAVLSNQLNANMASGGGLMGGSASGAQQDWSALTFANFNGFGNYGGIAAPSYNPGAGTALGSATLGAATYQQGDKRVLQYSGTLYIAGNQVYDNDGSDNNGYNSIADVPNIKIVADNIVVGAGVTRIDAWLVARNTSGTFGSISTCNTVSGFRPFTAGNLLNSTMCNQQIDFNGPVIANSLYAYRTFTSPTNDPAETFNLRANNFLSSYVGAGSDRPVARTELVTELPPRF